MSQTLITLKVLVDLLGVPYKRLNDIINALEWLLQLTFGTQIKQVPVTLVPVLEDALARMDAAKTRKDRNYKEVLRQALIAQRVGALQTTELDPDTILHVVAEGGVALDAMLNSLQSCAGTDAEREAALKTARSLSLPLYNLLHGVQVRTVNDLSADEWQTLMRIVNEVFLLLPKLRLLDVYVHGEVSPESQHSPAQSAPPFTLVLPAEALTMAGATMPVEAPGQPSWIDWLWATLDFVLLHNLLRTIGVTTVQWTVLLVGILADRIRTGTLLELYTETELSIHRHALADALEQVHAGTVAALIRQVEHLVPASISLEPDERFTQFEQLGPTVHAVYHATTTELREAMASPAFIERFSAYVAAHAAELPKICE